MIDLGDTTETSGYCVDCRPYMRLQYSMPSFICALEEKDSTLSGSRSGELLAMYGPFLVQSVLSFHYLELLCHCVL